MRASRLRIRPGGDPGLNRRTGFLPAFKKLLALSKENFDVLLKLAPLGLLPPAFILWWHLKTIYWSDVFLESAISPPGLIFLVLAGLTLWVLAVALFLVPSIPILTFTDILYDGRLLPRESMLASVGVFIGWVVVALLGVVFQFPVIFFLVVPVILAAVLVMWAHFACPSLFNGPERFGAMGRIILHVASMLVAMIVTALLFVVTNKVVAALPEMKGAPEYLKSVIALFMSWLGLIPGGVYLLVRVRHHSNQVANKAAIVGTLMVAYFVIAFALFFLPVGAMVLRAADVYSDDKFTFQILKDDLVGVMIKAGLPVENEKDMRVVSGYVRYSFGGMRLLCRDPFDPASASVSAVRAALEAGKPDPGRVGGAHCVKTETADLRKFSIENGAKPFD